jgi:hypothetical protein
MVYNEDRQPEETHQVDVDWAHSKDDKRLAGTHRVNVLASNQHEARLIAEQMVAARGKEPLGSTWVGAKV